MLLLLLCQKNIANSIIRYVAQFTHDRFILFAKALNKIAGFECVVNDLHEHLWGLLLDVSGTFLI